jgi:hypothetical protein
VIFINKEVIVIGILLMLPMVSYSKQSIVRGIITNTDEKPINLCLIKATNSNLATYSNEQGTFSLEYDTDSSNSLIFICMGYESKEVKIYGDTLKVVLNRKVNKLNEVVVHAGNRGKIKHGVMGKKNLKPFGICTGHIGQEYAIFLGADSSRHGELETMYFYITKEGVPNSRFRVHVYDIDTGYMPGSDLLDSIVILHANMGDEWVSADVSARHVAVGRGVFISIEWILGYGNNPNLVTSKNFPAAGRFNGQVPAYTQDYYKQSSLLYIRKNAAMPWRYLFAAGSFKKNTLNPMVYATYTYYKR